jgi:hypothetical protein
LREHSKTVLELAISYTCVVAVLDFFLGKIPVINYLALSLSFLFFTGLLLESVAKSLVTDRKVPSNPTGRREDELDRLERIIEEALFQRRLEFTKLLQERLRSIIIAGRRWQIGHLDLLLDDSSLVFVGIGEDFVARDLLADCSRAISNSSSQGIGKVLSKVESWLS